MYAVCALTQALQTLGLGGSRGDPLNLPPKKKILTTDPVQMGKARPKGLRHSPIDQE